jgi:hypothetical protein
VVHAWPCIAAIFASAFLSAFLARRHLLRREPEIQHAALQRLFVNWVASDPHPDVSRRSIDSPIRYLMQWSKQRASGSRPPGE